MAGAGAGCPDREWRGRGDVGARASTRSRGPVHDRRGRFGSVGAADCRGVVEASRALPVHRAGGRGLASRRGRRSEASRHAAGRASVRVGCTATRHAHSGRIHRRRWDACGAFWFRCCGWRFRRRSAGWSSGRLRCLAVVRGADATPGSGRWRFPGVRCSRARPAGRSPSPSRVRSTPAPQRRYAEPGRAADDPGRPGQPPARPTPKRRLPGGPAPRPAHSPRTRRRPRHPHNRKTHRSVGPGPANPRNLRWHSNRAGYTGAEAQARFLEAL